MIQNLKMESRHLGLIPVTEQGNLKSKIKKIASRISDFLDLEKLIQISNKTSSLPKIIANIPSKKPKTTIAVALDNSFNFYYHDNLGCTKERRSKNKIF